MNIEIYSHNCGESSVPEEFATPIKKFLLDSNFAFSPQSAPKLRNLVLSFLRLNGWSEETSIAHGSRLTVTSVRRGVALALQTGNVSHFYADILKLQYLHAQGKVSSALFLLPTKDAAQSMGSNIANYERLVGELHIFRQIITVPLLILGLGKG